MSEKEMNPLSDFECALAALKPAPAHLNRDRMMFEAGRRSMRHGWTWPLLTIVFAGISVSLATAQLMRSEPEASVRYVYVNLPMPDVPEPVPAPIPEKPGFTAVPPAVAPEPEPLPPLSPYSYWRLREVALRSGLDAMAALNPRPAESADPMPSPPLTVGSWRQMLN